MSGLVDNTTSSTGAEKGNIWRPRDASLLAIIAINTAVTLVCGCVVTVCVMRTLNKRSRNKEERDKLGHIIQEHYWQNEEKISKALHILSKMRQNVIFREVNELHVLSYKFRYDSKVFGTGELDDAATKWKFVDFPVVPPLLVTLRTVERFFEILTLQLPCRGSCPSNISSAFASTLYELAIGTALVWGDHKARIVRHLVHYFAGRHAADRFEASTISDDHLGHIILSRITYVEQLYLNEDHFVLKDVEVSSEIKVDLKNKIRFIDTVLAKSSKTLQAKEKNITEAYYNAREICLKNGFVQNKNHLPDIVSKVGEGSRLGECVVLLRHLLRVMVTGGNMKKLESDDKFFQFLMQLHEALYTWSDTSTMVEILERIRGNIFCYLRGLTIEQMLIDKEFTKAKLEHFEKELYRHLNYLTLRQVQQEKTRRQAPHGGATEASGDIRPAESDTSIYTLALSTSAYAMQRQASAEASTSGEGPRHHTLEMMHQQRSLDQSSIVSGSSMYATAVSLSSAAETAPLMPRQTPPESSPKSPPGSRARSPVPGSSKQRSSPPPGVDPNEYFETAV